EVPYAHTVVSSNGLIFGNCFPKDVSALKQLAGNSGYHFQLLTAVIEVNELQKRRVISKLQKHLGSLVGREVALLGLAFKPDTDDMREASSLVLAGRLQADGARVRAYDPVAEEAARGLMPGVGYAASADFDGPQAGRPARRPPVHHLHARVAQAPRRRRRGHVLRLHGQRRAQRARRRLAARPAAALRGGAAPAGDRRRGQVRRAPA